MLQLNSCSTEEYIEFNYVIYCAFYIFHIILQDSRQGNKIVFIKEGNLLKLIQWFK